MQGSCICRLRRPALAHEWEQTVATAEKTIGLDGMSVPWGAHITQLAGQLRGADRRRELDRFRFEWANGPPTVRHRARIRNVSRAP